MEVKNKIILGTVQFGLNYGINNQSGKVNERDIGEIFNYAHKKNISTLDTADAYGDAINIIGNYHNQNKNEFKIITKFKSTHREIDNLENLVKNSIKQLNISKIFGYLYHSFDDFKKYNYTLQELIALRDKGFIQHIGVSIYTNEQFEELLKYDEIEIIQLPYNLLDNSNKRGELIQRAKALGKIIHVRSVFLQGLFFKDLKTLPDKLLPLKKDLQTIRNITTEYQINMAALALNYALSNPNIDGVLIGVDNLEQLKINIKVAKQPLNQEIIAAIDAIFIQETSLLNPSNWL